MEICWRQTGTAWGAEVYTDTSKHRSLTHTHTHTHTHTLTHTATECHTQRTHTQTDRGQEAEEMSDSLIKISFIKNLKRPTVNLLRRPAELVKRKNVQKPGMKGCISNIATDSSSFGSYDNTKCVTKPRIAIQIYSFYIRIPSSIFGTFIFVKGHHLNLDDEERNILQQI